MFSKNSIIYLLLEASLIFISIFITFSIETYRSNSREIDRKNILLNELSEVITDDLNQLEKIIQFQLDCAQYANTLIHDFIGAKNLGKRSIADNYFKMNQNLPISFFPKKGIYNQILSSGSLGLIENDSLRFKMSHVYEDLDSRNNALSRSIDDFTVLWNIQLTKYITVVPEASTSSNAIYRKNKIQTFRISDNYYESNEILSFYAETKRFTTIYLSLMEQYETDLKILSLLIENELANKQ